MHCVLRKGTKLIYYPKLSDLISEANAITLLRPIEKEIDELIVKFYRLNEWYLRANPSMGLSGTFFSQLNH
jgi:hypothetical protein